MIKLVQVNDRGYRIGESHQRAKLTDHDVELLVGLLEARDVLIREYLKAGLTRAEVDKGLAQAQLSYKWLAEKFEVSKSQVRWIALGSQRAQAAFRVKRVHITVPVTG